MRKLKVYLDTSVVSYLYQLDTSGKMKEYAGIVGAVQTGTL